MGFGKQETRGKMHRTAFYMSSVRAAGTGPKGLRLGHLECVSGREKTQKE